jgi:hypothetical protein
MKNTTIDPKELKTFFSDLREQLLIIHDLDKRQEELKSQVRLCKEQLKNEEPHIFLQAKIYLDALISKLNSVQIPLVKPTFTKSRIWINGELIDTDFSEIGQGIHVIE